MRLGVGSGLPPGYPMEAPSYTRTRQEPTKKIGLGRKSTARSSAPAGRASRQLLSCRQLGVGLQKRLQPWEVGLSGSHDRNCREGLAAPMAAVSPPPLPPLHGPAMRRDWRRGWRSPARPSVPCCPLRGQASAAAPSGSPGQTSAASASTAASDTISPPTLAKRLARPTIATWPSSPIRTMSPVSYQPSSGGSMRPPPSGQQVAGHDVRPSHQQPVAIHPGHRLQPMLDAGKQPADRARSADPRGRSAPGRLAEERGLRSSILCGVRY